MNIRTYIYILIIAVICLPKNAISQEYGSPVKVPINLSGNFGEIRGSHFHSGVDIKMAAYTIEQRGVYNVADGYVSRIGISPVGFGNVLYIFHPATRTTSVYAHLDSFDKEIEQYVRKKQYEKKTFRTNLYPKATDFPLKKGERIGTAGNTGSSGGVHLHYEMRNDNQEPLNVLKERIVCVEDNISPAILSVTLMQIDSVHGVPVHTKVKRFPVKKAKDGLYILQDTVLLTKPSYFTVEFVDRMNGVHNTFCVYEMKLSVNKVDYFRYTIDMLNFSTTRYINSFTSYSQNRKSPYYVVRAFVSPNNKLKIYRKGQGQGIIHPEQLPTNNSVKIQLTDDNGNISTLSFALKAENDPSPCQDDTAALPINKYVLKWNKDNYVTLPNASLVVPKNALYDSEVVKFITAPKCSSYSEDYILQGLSYPTHRGMTLKIDDQALPANLRSKAIIVRGKAGYAGGKWADGKVVGSIYIDGTYRIGVDTIAPVIKSRQKKDQVSGNAIGFTISDNLSGISSYKGYINGKWELFEYDAKKKHLYHRFTRNKIAQEKNVRIEVIDRKGNKQTHKTIYHW